MQLVSASRGPLLALAVSFFVAPDASARNQSAWVPVDRLTPSELYRDVSTDGVHALVSFGPGGQPQAVVYRKERGAWTVEEELVKTASPGFPWGPCALRDGWAALSWQQSAGFVDVFAKGPSGWVLSQTLVDPTPGGSFGRDLAFGEGLLVVGDPMLANGSTSDVHVYALDAGAWTLVQTIDGPAAANQDDGFGLSVDVEASRLFVGAPEWANRGVVFVYERTNGPFVEVDRLVAGASDRGFGRSLAGHGTTLLVGARTTSSIPGAASLFSFDGAGWVLERRLSDPEGDSDSQFGRSVALGPGVAAVSAPWGLGGGDSKVYFLHRIAGRWVRTGVEDDPPPIPFGLFGVGMAFDRQQLLVTSNAGFQGGELHVYGPTFVLASPIGVPSAASAQ